MSDKIKIEVEAGVASFVSDMNRGGDAVDRFGRRAESARPFLQRLKEGFEIGAGIEAFHAGLELAEKPLDLLKESFEEVGRIGREALKLGVGAEDMSRFEHAANATHTEVGVLTAGMNKLNVEIGRVASGDAGAKNAAAALDKLHLSAAELAGLDPAETFKRVSAALGTVTNAYDRATIVQDLMGRGGKELLPIMGDLQGLMRESDEIGFTRTPEQIERVEQEERKLAAITDRVKGALMDLATSEFAEKLINGFARATDTAREFWNVVSGNSVAAQDVAAKNHLSGQADDFFRRRQAAADATLHETDPDKKVADQKQYMELLKEEVDLRKRLFAVGVAGATAQDAIVAQKILEANKNVLKTLEDRAAAQHRINAEAEHEKDVAADVGKTIDKLKEELAGTDKYGALLSRLTAEGATAGQIGEVGKLVDQLKTADRLKHEMGGFEQLWKKSQTPLEKYNEELKELNDLLSHGKITQEQFGKASQQAKLDMIADLKPENDRDRHRQASAITRSFDFRYAGGQQGDKQTELVNTQKQTHQLLAGWTDMIRQIWQAQTGTLASQQPANVLDLS